MLKAHRYMQILQTDWNPSQRLWLRKSKVKFSLQNAHCKSCVFSHPSQPIDGMSYRRCPEDRLLKCRCFLIPFYSCDLRPLRFWRRNMRLGFSSRYSKACSWHESCSLTCQLFWCHFALAGVRYLFHAVSTGAVSATFSLGNLGEFGSRAKPTWRWGAGERGEE
jgi:hypothetical protein